MRWERVQPASSRITFTWTTAAGTPPGRYRMRYLGTARGVDGTLTEIRGTTAPFAVRR